jgi:hypothetical protein
VRICHQSNLRVGKERNYPRQHAQQTSKQQSIAVGHRVAQDEIICSQQCERLQVPFEYQWIEHVSVPVLLEEVQITLAVEVGTVCAIHQTVRDRGGLDCAMEARIHVIDYHKQPACSQGLLQRTTDHTAVCTPDRKRHAKKATRKLTH